MKIRWCKAVLILIAIVASVLMFAFRSSAPKYRDEPLSYWVVELRNTNPGRQQEARKALREIGVQGLPFLLRMARKESSVLKRCYREAWFRLPDLAQRHFPQPESKHAALSFLSHALHQLGRPSGPALMEALEDKNAEVRFVAGASFPYGHDSPMGVLWEIKLLQTVEYDLKQSAAGILGTLGSKARPAIPALLEVAQHDGTDYVRETAARSLAMLVHPEMASVAPGLKKCLSDRSPAVRLWAAVTLWRINQDASVIPVLIADLRSASGEDGTCYAAIRVLGEAGALAKPATSKIRGIMLQFDPERMLPEGGADLVQAARDALRQIDPQTDPVEMLVP